MMLLQGLPQILRQQFRPARELHGGRQISFLRLICLFTENVLMRSAVWRWTAVSLRPPVWLSAARAWATLCGKSVSNCRRRSSGRTSSSLAGGAGG